MHVIYVSSYVPRECGIATFTKDLVDAIGRGGRAVESGVCAINEPGGIYHYGDEVKLQIDESDLLGYYEVADYINNSQADIVNIQHEFGIFGGARGEYLIPLLTSIQKPIVTTLHTVLPVPSAREKRIIQQIAKYSSAVVVMSKACIELLAEKYQVPVNKIRYIPHGMPDVEFVDSGEVKPLLGLDGRAVLSTFGLISGGKGIEYVIKALPKIVEEHPEVIYLVIGETHPQVRRKEGETYRKKLTKLVGELGLEKHVKFHNRYLSLDELIHYLQATDIYITPYLNPDQVVSGTLTYALGCGKAIISTPYIYAKEVLGEGRGFLVDFGDVEAIAGLVIKILANGELKEGLGHRIYDFSRQMTWGAVGESYLKLFEEVLEGVKVKELVEIPAIKLDYMKALTTQFGILQHAKYSIIDLHKGYSLDDNARAFLVALRYYELFGDYAIWELLQTYLSFMYFAQRSDGKFHNFVGRDLRFLDEEGSEDCLGRTLWACGCGVSSEIYDNFRRTAKEVFDRAGRWIGSLNSLRARSFCCLGLYNYLQAYPEADDLKERFVNLANSLVRAYQDNGSEDWQWFEPYLTYENGRLPQALFLAYDYLKDRRFLEVAKNSLDFLVKLVIIDNRLAPIGQKNWYRRGGERAYYDQQPVDAGSMVELFLTAYVTTGEKEYLEQALLAFKWFLGENMVKTPLYDLITGGCFDALTPEGVNLNQGAESVLSYLLARLAIEAVGRTE